VESNAKPTISRRRPVVHLRPTVHLLCGLNGAGKTTLAKELQTRLPAVRFSLDKWMLRLYPAVHFAAAEYGGVAETCKLPMWDTARQVLRDGRSGPAAGYPASSRRVMKTLWGSGA